MISRQQRRAAEREDAKGTLKIGNGPGRRLKWLQRHEKLALFYLPAISLLKTGDRSQVPSWRAVRKMMVALATAPRIFVHGLGRERVPYLYGLAQHKRPTWRSFPHQPINANLKVEQ